ncbi:MAG: aminoglycoside phosphotransferase family protein [Actinomycetota bacterium]
MPERLATNCLKSPETMAWLERLPDVVAELEARWVVTLGPPYDGPEVSASWVAPALRADGTSAVLKVGLPHMEAEHEIDGLRFWDGDPTVRLFEADDTQGAMLLERCEPGTPLRSLPEPEQDVVIAGLLRRLWRVPSAPHPFRPLSEMIGSWIEETMSSEPHWSDPGLVRDGLRVFDDLLNSPTDDHVLLSTDLHAGNVLRSQREPWLVIDVMPFVGDPAYDATQHLLNCEARMHNDPDGTIARFTDLLQVNTDRVRAWLFARVAAESGGDRESWADLARVLAHE